MRSGHYARGPIEDRFWPKVRKTESCWFWTGSASSKGYGQVWYGGKVVPAHRVSLILSGTQVNASDTVDHVCYNPGCVNPEHLRVVNKKQNAENLSTLPSNNSSGYRGVSWSKTEKKWRAYVTHNQKQYSAGYFDDVTLAADAAKALRLRLFTHNDQDKVRENNA